MGDSQKPARRGDLHLLPVLPCRRASRPRVGKSRRDLIHENADRVDAPRGGFRIHLPAEVPHAVEPAEDIIFGAVGNVPVRGLVARELQLQHPGAAYARELVREHLALFGVDDAQDKVEVEIVLDALPNAGVLPEAAPLVIHDDGNHALSQHAPTP